MPRVGVAPAPLNGLTSGWANGLKATALVLARDAMAAHGLTAVPDRSVKPRSTWQALPTVAAGHATTTGPELPGPGGWEELQDRVSGRVPSSPAALESSSFVPAPPKVRCRWRRRSSAQPPRAAASATTVAPTAMPAMAPLLRLLLLLGWLPPAPLEPLLLLPLLDCSCSRVLFTVGMRGKNG